VIVVVAAALIATDGRILVQRRPPGGSMAGLWEFPGGKVEFGEGATAALARELREELGIAVAIDDLDPGPFVETEVNGRPLVILLFLCRRWTGTCRALQATELQWLPVDALDTLAMPPADYPLVDRLSGLLGRARSS
jgi:8-oxo-dGTP diphosphatase